jgi:hypothetical protein
MQSSAVLEVQNPAIPENDITAALDSKCVYRKTA